MFSLADISHSTQRTICMVLATVIVTASLSLGAFAVELPLHPGYSVTVTQLS